MEVCATLKKNGYTPFTSDQNHIDYKFESLFGTSF